MVPLIQETNGWKEKKEKEKFLKLGWFRLHKYFDVIFQVFSSVVTQINLSDFYQHGPLTQHRGLKKAYCVYVGPATFQESNKIYLKTILLISSLD